MHAGWTRSDTGVLPGLDVDGDGPTSVRGALMDYDEVQLAGDGELLLRSPYLAYKPEDTRVVVYCLAGVPKWGGESTIVPKKGAITVMNAKQARYHCTKQFGPILEENAAGDHLFLRVARERK